MFKMQIDFVKNVATHEKYILRKIGLKFQNPKFYISCKLEYFISFVIKCKPYGGSLNLIGFTWDHETLQEQEKVAEYFKQLGYTTILSLLTYFNTNLSHMTSTLTWWSISLVACCSLPFAHCSLLFARC